ncbi:tetratricopeptide repeat protein [Lusitaniella coriacea LEGE 07157]|uniref:Tetratricopeptide repeat protein n=1 Tax=Lusitaniella coriacea LEGE 07157 TaxID=945747 RepID=A0A8J7DVF0_9CYAN|nr:tetratricopeptide repeat protein [Lusitaniella coriacea]MBE9115761.1 tetratricopeptide repeat protein [Lusitaniella coriacea LEGE 07157]
MTTLIPAYSVGAYLVFGLVCYLVDRSRVFNSSSTPIAILLWPLLLIKTATSKDNSTEIPEPSATENIQSNPENLALLSQRTDSHLHEEGIALMEMGQYSKALSYFERLLKLRPDDCTALVLQASILSLLERHSEALEILDGALTLQPNDPSILFFRGIVTHEMGSYQQSYASYDQAMRLQQQWEQTQSSPSSESTPSYPQQLAKPIGQLLQEAGLLSANEVVAILRYQAEHETHHLRFGEISSRWGLVKPETVEFFVQLPEQPREQDYPLGQYFKSAALLNENQISALLNSQLDSGLRFGELAVRQGLLAQETVDFFVDYVSQN